MAGTQVEPEKTTAAAGAGLGNIRHLPRPVLHLPRSRRAADQSTINLV